MVAGQARRCLGRVEQEQERAVGEQPADGVEVELEHALEAEPAPDALVRDRGVDVAVADDRGAALERGPDHLVHVLCARGGVQQGLGPRRDVATVEDELADPLAELGASRLARRDDLLAVGLEPRAQELRLGRLARAVEAFEGRRTSAAILVVDLHVVSHQRNHAAAKAAAFGELAPGSRASGSGLAWT